MRQQKDTNSKYKNKNLSNLNSFRLQDNLHGIKRRKKGYIKLILMSE